MLVTLFDRVVANVLKDGLQAGPKCDIVNNCHDCAIEAYSGLKYEFRVETNLANNQ